MLRLYETLKASKTNIAPDMWTALAGRKMSGNKPEDVLVNNLTSKEVNGLTVTRNADGSVSVKGTSTANTNLCIYNDSLSTTAAAYQIIENGQYLIGGGIAGYKRAYSGSALAGNGVEGIGSMTTQTGNNTILDVMQSVGTFSRCVIFGGTNDFGNSENIDAFRAAVQNTLDYALDQTPYILVVTPIMRENFKTRVNNVGKKLVDYSNVIIEECENRGIAYVDGMSVSLNPDNASYKSTFIPDGLHPNATGHTMLARKLYSDFLAAMAK